MKSRSYLGELAERVYKKQPFLIRHGKDGHEYLITKPNNMLICDRLSTASTRDKACNMIIEALDGGATKSQAKDVLNFMRNDHKTMSQKPVGVFNDAPAKTLWNSQL